MLQETFDFKLLDLSAAPLFKLETNNTRVNLRFFDSNADVEIGKAIFLDFPQFARDENTTDFTISSWQASYLAIIECLFPNVLPVANAEAWIESFNLSVGNRRKIAQRTNLEAILTEVLPGSKIRSPNQLCISLEHGEFVHSNHVIDEAYYEVIELPQPARMYSAVILGKEAWIYPFPVSTDAKIKYQGEIIRFGNKATVEFLERFSEMYGLCAVTFLLSEHSALLYSLHFDVLNYLPPGQFEEFIEKLVTSMAQNG